MTDKGMETRTVVRVRIVGEEYTLRTDASPDHTRAVAEHVDRTIRAILAGGPAIETHKAAVLAALQITDELLRERGAADALAADIRQLAADIRPLLPPALRGDEGGA
jgi:cell division protein ZapA